VPHDPTDRVVKMFWQSFPDRQYASRALAAITLVSQRLGPVDAIDLMRKMAKAVEGNEKCSILSVARPLHNICLIGPTPANPGGVEMLEHIMDLLVDELRALKKAAPATVV